MPNMRKIGVVAIAICASNRSTRAECAPGHRPSATAEPAGLAPVIKLAVHTHPRITNASVDYSMSGQPEITITSSMLAATGPTPLVLSQLKIADGDHEYTLADGLGTIDINIDPSKTTFTAPFVPLPSVLYPAEEHERGGNSGDDWTGDRLRDPSVPSSRDEFDAVRALQHERYFKPSDFVLAPGVQLTKRLGLCSAAEIEALFSTATFESVHQTFRWNNDSVIGNTTGWSKTDGRIGFICPRCAVRNSICPECDVTEHFLVKDYSRPLQRSVVVTVTSALRAKTIGCASDPFFSSA